MNRTKMQLQIQEGFDFAQSVLYSYADELGLSKDLATESRPVLVMDEREVWCVRSLDGYGLMHGRETEKEEKRNHILKSPVLRLFYK